MEKLIIWCLFVLGIWFQNNVSAQQTENGTNRDSIYIGPCTYIIDRKCPDPDVKFWLFTRSNAEDRQLIQAYDTWDKSNLSSSFFNPQHPVKIIIHGYNSDMMLTPLIGMKNEYLQRGSYNLFYVDYAVLVPSPCYPASVNNAPHVGECIAQLIERILETGQNDIHLIGFSLGAQVSNYVANKLKPDFIIPRISGLDPALPLFAHVGIDSKLDATDAEFVDVIHTNALVQGKIERCGHVDFYLNGGVYQPGCTGFIINPFACSHHRAPLYFMESIQSEIGFWGWRCQSYLYYLLGLCPPIYDMQTVAGEDCRSSSRGMYFIKTSDISPYAIGRLSEEILSITEKQQTLPMILSKVQNSDPFQKEIDSFGKLEGNFNNLQYSNTNQDIDEFPYFNHRGSNKITHAFIEKLRNNHRNEADILKQIDKPTVIKKRVTTRRKKPSMRLPNSKTSERKLYSDDSVLGNIVDEMFN